MRYLVQSKGSANFYVEADNVRVEENGTLVLFKTYDGHVVATYSKDIWAFASEQPEESK